MTTVLYYINDKSYLTTSKKPLTKVSELRTLIREVDTAHCLIYSKISISGVDGLVSQRLEEDDDLPSPNTNNRIVIWIESNATSYSLAKLSPSIQINLWRSVIRILTHSSMSTGLVVGDHEDQLYILTMLHSWDNHTPYLSQECIDQLDLLRVDHNTSIGSYNSDNDVEDATVFIHQKVDAQVLEQVHKFKISPENCFKASAERDFLILKVEKPSGCQLRKID
jgi:hypothetical protein